VTWKQVPACSSIQIINGSNSSRYYLYLRKSLDSIDKADGPARCVSMSEFQKCYPVFKCK
jgi:hypothetical protein